MVSGVGRGLLSTRARGLDGAKSGLTGVPAKGLLYRGTRRPGPYTLNPKP